MRNVVIPFYKHAHELTGQATAAITAGTLVKISGNRADGENLKVAPAGAGDVPLGVADRDATAPANGAKPVEDNRTGVVRRGSMPCLVSGAVTAGQALEAAPNGRVRTATTGPIVGIAGRNAADGTLGELILTL